MRGNLILLFLWCCVGLYVFSWPMLSLWFLIDKVRSLNLPKAHELTLCYLQVLLLFPFFYVEAGIEYLRNFSLPQGKWRYSQCCSSTYILLVIFVAPSTEFTVRIIPERIFQKFIYFCYDHDLNITPIYYSLEFVLFLNGSRSIFSQRCIQLPRHTHKPKYLIHIHFTTPYLMLIYFLIYSVFCSPRIFKAFGDPHLKFRISLVKCSSWESFPFTKVSSKKYPKSPKRLLQSNSRKNVLNGKDPHKLVLRFHANNFRFLWFERGTFYPISIFENKCIYYIRVYIIIYLVFHF